MVLVKGSTLLSRLLIWHEFPSAFSQLMSLYSNLESSKKELSLHLLKKLNIAHMLESIPIVHIVGTKGKGSTSALTSLFLAETGLKVGLFTSPHLFDLRERILINNRMLSKKDFCSYFLLFSELLKSGMNSYDSLGTGASRKATFFTLMFVFSLFIFNRENVDVAVYEAGIGCKADVTSLLSSKVGVITALGIDHTDYIGSTIEEISLEKAHVMKGQVCFSASQMYPAAKASLIRHALKTDTPINFLESLHYSWKTDLIWEKMTSSVLQLQENAKLALLASRALTQKSLDLSLSISEENVIRKTKIPGRFQRVLLSPHIEFYIDGSHTPESVCLALQWFLKSTQISVKAFSEFKKSSNVILLFCTRDPMIILSVLKDAIPFNTIDMIFFVIRPKIRVSLIDCSDATDDKDRIFAESYHQKWIQLCSEIPATIISLPDDIWTFVHHLRKAILPHTEKCKNVINCTSSLDENNVPMNILCIGSLFFAADILGRLLPMEKIMMDNPFQA